MQWLVFRRLLPNPSRLNTAFKLLRLVDVVGLRSAARKTGLMKLLGDAGKAEAMVPKVPANGGLDAITRFTKRVEHPKYRVAYFVGCSAANLSPGVAAATIRILHRHQVEVTVPTF